MINNLLAFADVMKSIGGVVLAIVILLAMITIHEFGHYLAGKLLGFKINEFAVGFGPAIFKRRSKKTGELFALRAIPLGGYCAFDGEDGMEDEEENEGEKTPFEELKTEESLENEAPMSALTKEKQEEEEYPEPQGERFNDQPPWKRIIVLIAGATMNYLLALVLIILMFGCFGRPVYKVAQWMPEEEEAVAIVEEPLPEALKLEDVILEVEGQTVYMITDYLDILDGKKAGEEISLTVLRNGEKLTVYRTLQKDADFANLSDVQTLLHALDIGAMYSVTERDGFFETIGHSFMYSFKIGGTVLRSLGELLTGKLGMEAMGGPITTIQVTAQAASSGILSFLNISAFIGVNLAVFNLLPVPALDGCKVIFCLLEWIRKKPINRKVEGIINLVGMLFILGFAVLADLLKLF
ncbi:MAG: site-2 protease family protein [Clostridia bacterium]|nr:site-2 protease family protein [Clostridia bacterium]